MPDSQHDDGFSYPINVRKLSKKGQMVRFKASDEVRQEIARGNDLLEVQDFTVDCLVAPWKRDGVKLTGALKAQVTQPCATTGEPLNQVIEEDLDYTFLPEGSRFLQASTMKDDELIIDPLGEDMPDTFAGDSVDLVGPWMESFVLGLDPFARIDGAEFDAENLDRESDSPFAVLAALKSEAKKS